MTLAYLRDECLARLSSMKAPRAADGHKYRDPHGDSTERGKDLETQNPPLRQSSEKPMEKKQKEHKSQKGRGHPKTQPPQSA